MFGRPDLTHKSWRRSVDIRLQQPLIKINGLNHLKNFIHWGQILLHKFHNHSDFWINLKLWLTKIANRTLNAPADILIKESFQTIFLISVDDRTLEFDATYGEIAHCCIRHLFKKIWSTLVVSILTLRITRYTSKALKALWTNHDQANKTQFSLKWRPCLQDQVQFNPLIAIT